MQILSIVKMSRKLRKIFEENIKLDRKEANKYESILRLVLAELISVMAGCSNNFSDLFDKPYFGGSFFDGLKVAATMQEFDINMIFKMPANVTVSIADLGQDEKKPNFSYLNISSWFGFTRSVKSVSVQTQEDGQYYLSPENLFSLLHDAAEAALAKIGGIIHIDRRIYRL